MSRINDVELTDDTLIVRIGEDFFHIPLSWYPRLAAVSIEERSKWSFIGNGQGLHWASLDEDISLEGIIEGRASGECSASFHRWLDSRN